MVLKAGGGWDSRVQQGVYTKINEAHGVRAHLVERFMEVWVNHHQAVASRRRGGGNWWKPSVVG